MWVDSLNKALACLTEHLNGKHICLKKVYPVYKGIVFETTFEYNFFWDSQTDTITGIDLKEVL